MRQWQHKLKHPVRYSNDKRAGVTLVEMSVVLVIIGLIILIIFPALVAVRSSTQQTLTTTNLQTLLRATAVYAQANGCVPCPTPAITTGKGYGVVRGDGGTKPNACAGCTNPEGVPPFASLGIPASVAHDGWGHWITMRVDPDLAINFGVVPPTSPCLAGEESCPLGKSQKGMCRADRINTKEYVNVSIPGGGSQKAAVIFVSHGKNGYRAFTSSALFNELNGERLPTFPSNTPTCANGGYEACNTDGDREFTDASPVSGGGTEYDDQMTYLDRNNLVSMLGNGACSTAW